MLRAARFAPLTVLALLACSSSGGDGAPTATTTASVTFHEHVESVLQSRCQTCHHPGGIGPFSLTTYAEARRWGARMVEVTRDRVMPPWGAFPTDECKPRFGFKDDLRMTDAETALVKSWVDQGSVEGDPSKAPAPRSFGGGGLAGATDTLAIAPYTVQPGKSDELRCFVIDPKLAEDTWIDGTNVVAGDPTVVHHVLVFTDPKGEASAKADASGSYPCFGGVGVSSSSLLLAWAPGVPPVEYGANVGTRVTKGSQLVLQVHYHPGADAKTDATKIELRRKTTKPEWAATVRLIGNFGSAPLLLPGPGDDGAPQFKIPAGAKGHTETMELTVPASTPEVKLASVGTHMHWVGKDMKIDIERADGRAGQPSNECLLQTPRYDFNWQRGYAYDAKIDDLPTVKAGDKLRLRCTYDNSTDNPYVVKALSEQKLSSPIDVFLGEETLDEMCLGAFTFLAKVP